MAEDRVGRIREDNESRDFVVDVEKVVFDPLFHIHHVTLVNSIPLVPDLNHPRTGDNEVQFIRFVRCFRLRIGILCEFDAQRVLGKYFDVVRIFLLKPFDQVGR
ncbi:MAG: hypothetical protein V5A55_13205 [Halovenus sp.]